MATFSVFHFGLKKADIFGVIVLLETIFTILHVDTSITTLLSWPQNATEVYAHDLDFGLDIGMVVVYVTKFIVFFGLLWIGFICLNKGWLLGLWILVGSLLDVGNQIITLVWLHHFHYVHEQDVSIWEYLLHFITVIVFRTYIYAMVWIARQELTQGTDFRGYGQGLSYLFHYYKNEFKRVASILLVVEIIWNLRLVLEFHLPIEMGLNFYGMEGHSSYFTHMTFSVFHVTRLALAIPSLYFVMSEKDFWVKWCAIPFSLLSFGIDLLIWALIVMSEPVTYMLILIFSLHVPFVFLFRSAILFYLVRLVLRKPNAPVPLQQSLSGRHQHEAEKLDDDDEPGDD